MNNATKKNVRTVPAAPHIIQTEKVGLYCRISTKAEDQLKSLRTQISLLVRKCASQKLYVIRDIYIDICSGDDRFTYRPEFSRMLEDVKRGYIDLVFVKSSSRFGRDTVTVLKAIRLLHQYGAYAYFDLEALDSRDSMAELILSTRSAMNQAENDGRSANIRWAQKKGAKDGTSKVYNTPCYGYRKGEDGKLEIVETEADVIRQIYQWYIEGRGLCTIRKNLCEKRIISPTGKATWCVGSVDKILTNRKYTGSSSVFLSEVRGVKPKATLRQKQMYYTEYRMEESHPAIISEEIYEKVQSLKQSKAIRKRVLID